ncbi:phosphocholine-specific phospholipase C [Mucilaginibacter panaciglaebae]|uniref:phospholipase C n=1 Tax=Mucilaginibacter panaciglaebae TaxID=502331 RepID=A0ABP7WNB3_9SPHI
MDNRRDFIKKAALLTGTAGLATGLPSSIARAMNINAPEGSNYLDAEHVVILMQENRSFDHVFGTLRGVRGYNDPRAIQLADKNPVWLQTNAEGQTYAPFHLDIKNTKATWMHSLPHTWSNQVNARNDGRHDKWLDEKHSSDKAYRNMPLTLGYHNRNDVPFYYALADAFTVCDQNFCSSLTGTNPNRLYFWTGTIRDHKDENSRPLVWNEDMDYGTLNWTTFPERLEDLGIDWRCYQNEISIDTGLEGEEDAWLSNFQDNDLEFFGQYNIQLHPRHVAQMNKRLAALNNEIASLQKQAETDKSLALKKKLEQRQSAQKKVKAQLDVINSRKFDDLTAREQSIHKKAFTVNYGDPDFGKLVELTYDDNGTTRTMQVPKGDVLYQFRKDVKTGKLPTVSWLTAPENFSDHPSAPWYGAWYVSEVLDILTQNPEVWKKTIFILTYDENDGYFDHVPPFTAPHSHKPGTGKVSAGIDTRPDYVTLEQEQAREGFPTQYDRECSIGLGFRVPMVIASPWSKGGWVNSEVFDHTSTLQFLEKFLSHKTGKKVFEPNISDWRRTVCGDLSSVFRPYEAKQSALPAFVARNSFLEGIHKAKFKDVPANFKVLTAPDVEQIKSNRHNSALLPQQERGIKHANALPYQLYADGKLNADKTAFEVNLHTATEVWGNKTIGAPFIIYAPDKYKSLKGDGYELLRNWNYAVKPGDTLADTWPVNEFENSDYHLRLYGPNGFYREFKGSHADPEIETQLEYQRNRLNKKVLTGNVELYVKNLSKGQHIVTITDNAYKTGTQKKTVLPQSQSSFIVYLTKSMGWYDFTLKVSGANGFEKRFAGRVETGKAGYTDPFMGRVV